MGASQVISDMISEGSGIGEADRSSAITLLVPHCPMLLQEND